MTFLSLQFPGAENSALKILYILVFAIVAHLVVLGIRHFSAKIVNYKTGRVPPKTRSIASLANSFIVFSIYFWVVGLILQSLGVSLTAYLASASVIGLAVGFGSQGLVQDVVTGLTMKSVKTLPGELQTLAPPTRANQKPQILSTAPIYLNSITANTRILCKIVAPPSYQPVRKDWPDIEVIITVE